MVEGLQNVELMLVGESTSTMMMSHSLFPSSSRQVLQTITAFIDIQDAKQCYFHRNLNVTHSARLEGMLIHSILILAVALCYCHCQSSSPIRGKSFCLRTSISRSSSTRNDVRHLEECYDSVMRRAKLAFDLPGQAVGQFHYDLGTGDKIITNLKHNICHKGNLDFVYVHIFHKMKISALYKLINDLDLGYFIGMSNFILLLEQNKDDLQLFNSTELIRNHAVKKYMLSLDLEEISEKAVMQIYYGLDALDATSSIPLSIWIQYVYSGEKVRIDFFEYKEFNSKINLDSMIIEDVSLDKFSIPIGINCSRHLNAPVDAANLYQQYNMGLIRLSFEAQVYMANQAKTLDYFVAYDGFTENSRVDTVDHKLSRRTKNVLDFRLNRRYIISDQNNHRFFDKSLMIDLEWSRVERDRNCAIVQFMTANEVQNRNSYLKLPTFLFGGEHFYFMGWATVKGLRVKVYEAYTDSLPFWLDLPIKHIDDKGSSTHFRPSVGNHFNVIIYLTDGTVRDSLKPMRMEIYDLIDLYKRGYPKLVASVNFVNYLWNLNKYPDGDSIGELFSLREDCSDHFNMINLKMKSDKKRLEWIEEGNDRNDALMITMTRALNIQTAMISNLESKWVDGYGGFMIAINFEFGKQIEYLYKIESLGRANIDPSATGVYEFKTSTIESCLFVLGQMKRPSINYYSFEQNLCLIDLNLLHNNRNLKDSKVFRKDEQGSGELYRIQSIFDADLKETNAWVDDEIARRSKINKLLIIKNIELDGKIQSIDSDEMRMKIKEIHVKEANKNTRGESKSYTSSNKIRGFRFLSADKDKTHYWQYKSGSDDKTMSREECQTACLTSFNCKASSYCLRMSGVECTLTSDSNLVESQSVEGEMQKQSIEDPRCDIYFKSFTSQFKKQSLVSMNVQSMDLVPVESAESCAGLCFVHNIRFVNSSLTLSRHFRDLLDSGQGDVIKILSDLRTKFEIQMKEFCLAFGFFSSMSLDGEQEILLETKLLPIADTNQHKNFCFLKYANQNTNIDGASDPIGIISVDYYSFDFLSLYKKSYDIRLPSKLSLEEQTAWDLFLYGSNVENGELLSKAVLAKKNFKNYVNDDVASCAHLCFTQFEKLWPICQSFDMVYSYADGDLKHASCFYNSLTSDQVGHEYNDEDSKSVHYELKFNFQNLNSHGISDDEYVEDYDSDSISCETDDKYNRVAGLGGFFVTLIIVLGLVSGSFLGVKLAKQYEKSSQINNNDVAYQIPNINSLILETRYS